MILVTGGLGYIGSHTCVELLQSGYEVLIIDDLSNSHRPILDRIIQITGLKPHFIQARIQDIRSELFQYYPIQTVIHFAGCKAVKESVQKPLKYYQNNVQSSLHLLQIMRQAGVKSLIFSSSATVYAESTIQPLKEHFKRDPINPYGRSKLMVEWMMEDLYRADPEWNLIRLRYFNPAGAHPSGLIGEWPQGQPNNLMPIINQVASGQLKQLAIFGRDYDTPDGTGMRDYIHVVDLARGHVQALKKNQPGLFTYNLGTGQAYSVLDMIRTYEQINGQKIHYYFAPRRPGDLSIYYADPSRAADELGWQAEKGLKQICQDSWHWQQCLHQ